MCIRDSVYTDTAFFQVFPFEVMAGNLTDMKKGKYIVLSEKMAIKLFGSATAAIGQKLKEVADDLYGWEAKKEYCQIHSGITDLRPLTHPSSSFLIW